MQVNETYINTSALLSNGIFERLNILFRVVDGRLMYNEVDMSNNPTYDKEGNIIICPLIYNQNPNKYTVVPHQKVNTNGGKPKRNKKTSKADN